MDPAAAPDPAYAFVLAQTAVARPPLVPELSLYLATEISPLWEATEETLASSNLPPPYWAFCWAGGQALARHVLDNPDLVAGRRVLDFAAGCGVVALAAARAGARAVDACEIDPFALAAQRANADLNGLAITPMMGDLVGRDDGPWDVVLAGDIFYERAMTDHVLPWLKALASRGARVLVADPGRAYLPKNDLVALGTYTVPTLLELEDREQRETIVYALLP